MSTEGDFYDAHGEQLVTTAVVMTAAVVGADANTMVMLLTMTVRKVVMNTIVMTVSKMAMVIVRS